MAEEKSGETEKTFSQIETEMQARGYIFVGNEPLTKFHFSPDAKFAAKPYRTKEEIIELYAKGSVKVELVDIENLGENQQAVYVFIKEP